MSRNLDPRTLVGEIGDLDRAVVGRSGLESTRADYLARFLIHDDVAVPVQFVYAERGSGQGAPNHSVYGIYHQSPFVVNERVLVLHVIREGLLEGGVEPDKLHVSH